MSQKIKMIKDYSKEYLKDFHTNNNFQIFSPGLRPKLQIKKIILDCLSLKDDKNQNKTNKKITNINKKTPKKKSFSLYKYSISKNNNNLYAKLCGKTQIKKKKIIINCLEEKKGKKIPKSVETKKMPKAKRLSNGSTRKSSDASPVDIQAQTELKKNNLNSRNNRQYWKSLKINCVTLKKHNNEIKINSSKNELKTKTNIVSKSKEKDEVNAKNKDCADTSHPVIPAQYNYFLNCSKGNNTTGKKEPLYNSVYQKKIEPLKLFDYDASSSSSAVEDEEKEAEENEQNQDDLKKDNSEEEKHETEFTIDSKFKISEGELSDDLDDIDEDNKIKHDILKKKLCVNAHQNKEEKINIKKPEKSCKNITTKFLLAPNNNQISNKKIIISSILTKPGISDDKEKINQDSHLIIENLFSLNFNIYGIFDGHGDNGHLISKFISEFMNDYYNNKLNYYLNEKDKQKLFTEKITNIFLGNHLNIINNCSSSLDQEISAKINYDINDSGSTSVIVFLVDDVLICSNVGDSQCFLFNCSSEDLWTFESLSKIHLASDEKEQKRIVECGGEIHPYFEEDGVFEGPDRIYAKNKIYPGLVMSRTIGDLEAKKIGVISEPDLIFKKIDNNSKFLVIGSDGLWDAVKPYDVIRIVRPYFNKGDIEGACQILMKKAVQQWEKEKEERDDITIIVVFIGTPNCLINGKNSYLKKIEENDEEKEQSSKKLIHLK